MDIVEVIYRPEHAQGHAKDYDFSRTTMGMRGRRVCPIAGDDFRSAMACADAAGGRCTHVRRSREGSDRESSKNSLNNKAGG